MRPNEISLLNHLAFRMTSLQSFLESFQTYLTDFGPISGQSLDSLLLTEVTSDSLSLMMEVVLSWRFAAHMYLLRNESTSLQTLKDLQLTCLEKLRLEGFFPDAS